MAAVKKQRFTAITHAISQHAERTPDRTAVAISSREISYVQLWQQIRRAAGWYQGQGIRQGDRIILTTRGADPVFPAAYFGAHLAGAVAVPVDARLTPEDIALRSKLVDASIELSAETVKHLQAHIEADKTEAVDFAPVSEAGDDVADIMFTTGSTGAPKAVALTMRNIAAAATLMADFIGNTRLDTEVVTLPLTHSFGLGRLRSVLLVGGSLTVVPGLVFPQVAIRTMAEQAATGLSCVPAGMRLLLSRCRDGLESLRDQIRYVELGSAPLSAAEKALLCTIFPAARICMHYGLTEASRSAFTELHSDQAHLDSVGKATPGIEIRVCDASGAEARPGETGRIFVRGPNVMCEYWNDRAATRDALADESGWLDTRDLGHLDRHGYLYLAGRADEVINCGGVKLLPEALEKIAATFPGVDEVACGPVADPGGVLGQVPKLYVTTAAADDFADDELARFVIDRYAGRIASLQVGVVASLPRTESGKLLRHRLQETVGGS